jgi:hypothetical protein
MRAETGTMKFEGDWRGVFIRGDNAFGYAMNIKMMLEHPESTMRQEIGRVSMEGLLELLLSSDERSDDPATQHMKPFSECVAAKAASGGA